MNTKFSTLALTITVTLSTCLSANELLQSVKVDKNSIRVTASKEFHDRYLLQDFFTEYDKDCDLSTLDFSLVTIPFIMNVIPIIWISEATYTIESMDHDLYYALATIQKVFQVFYPSKKWSGTLIPKKLVKNSIIPDHKTIAALFSHGLDAVYTSLHNHEYKQILITVCGGDIGLSKPLMWKNVQQHCKQFAHTHGHQNAFVRSNFNTFRNFKYLRTLTPEIKNWFSHTSQGLGYTGLAAPIAYLHNCPILALASTRTSDNPFPYGTHPLIDNSIAFAGITVEHDGPEVTRLEKIREIATLCSQHNKPKPMLRVCWGNDPQGGNCNTCEKCFRTIVELLVEGQIPQDYGFNITLDQALYTAQTQAPGKKKLNEGLLWHWQCIQRRAQHIITAHPSFLAHKKLNNFIRWIAMLDLAQFCATSNRTRSAQEKQLFAWLWKRAANRTFTVADLEPLLPQIY